METIVKGAMVAIVWHCPACLGVWRNDAQRDGEEGLRSTLNERAQIVKG
jgi:hypothetical protein